MRFFLTLLPLALLAATTAAQTVDEGEVVYPQTGELSSVAEVTGATTPEAISYTEPCQCKKEEPQTVDMSGEADMKEEVNSGRRYKVVTIRVPLDDPEPQILENLDSSETLSEQEVDSNNDKETTQEKSKESKSKVKIFSKVRKEAEPAKAVNESNENENEKPKNEKKRNKRDTKGKSSTKSKGYPKGKNGEKKSKGKGKK